MTWYGLRALHFAMVGMAMGCGSPTPSPAYRAAYAEGARAETAGRFSDAAEGYREASSNATRARDRSEALYAEASMLERSGNFADASDRFRTLADASPPNEHSARAAYEVAAIRIAHGDGEDGWAALEVMIHRFPDSGLARVALHRLSSHLSATLPAPLARQRLEALQSSLGATELGEDLAFEVAKHWEETGDLVRARDAFVSVASRWPYPKGAHFDDALWNASLADERLGNYVGAANHLVRMINERETSYFIGSYERPRFSDAQLRLARLFRDRLHDHARAKKAFKRLYLDFKTSLKRDEALWEEAALWRDEGQQKTACLHLDTLVHEFPESRYVPCVLEECVDLRTPNPSKLGHCHSYIRRGIEPNASTR